MMGILWWGEESGGRVFPPVAVSMLRGTHGSATSMDGILIHGSSTKSMEKQLEAKERLATAVSFPD